MTAPSIISALAAHYAATSAPRGDEADLHASDAWKCAREVWARRNGVEQLGFSCNTRMKFALGNAVEDHVAAAIEAPLADAGWTLVRDVVVNWQGVIGHVDYVLERRAWPSLERERHGEPPLERIVVEVKSTTFFPKTIDGRKVRQLPNECKWHYIMQAGTYALAVGADRFCVVIVCRESGMVAEFWFVTAEYSTEIRTRLDMYRRLTPRGAPEPVESKPSSAVSWSCAFCSHTACPRNSNIDAMRVEA